MEATHLQTTHLNRASTRSKQKAKNSLHTAFAGSHLFRAGTMLIVFLLLLALKSQLPNGLTFSEHGTARL